MSSLEQRLFDGTRAKEVLENEAFKGAFDAIENEVIEQWKNSPARDAEGRERIWTYLQLLKKVRMHLQSTMETGQLAELELKSRQSAWDRAKTWIS